MSRPANYLNLRWIGPRVWNPDRTPPPERGPATCLSCGDHFDDEAGPCPCHEAHIASEVDAAPLLSWLLANPSAWDEAAA